MDGNVAASRQAPGEMARDGGVSVEDAGLDARLARRGRFTVVGILLTLLAVTTVGAAINLEPWSPPRVVHVWGHDYSAAGGLCGEAICTAPPAAAPVSLAEARTLAAPDDPTLLHLLPPPAAWLGITDAGTKPTFSVSVVFVQAAPDAFIPYRLITRCCEHPW